MAIMQKIPDFLFGDEATIPKELVMRERVNNHATTLFHYTREESSLLSILKEGLRFTFCLEEYPLLQTLYVGVPMISFCDIPISDSVEHSNKYGKYAIGLTKESLFGCKDILKRLSPVHYFISPESIKPIFQERGRIMEKKKEFRKFDNFPIRKQLINQVESMETGDYTKVDGISTELVREATSINMYIKQNLSPVCLAIGLLKPYYSWSKKKGAWQSNYDECEWRIIEPEVWTMDGEGFDWLWTKDEYEKWRGENEKKAFIEDAKITFTADCIGFIVVPTEKEVPTFIQKLKSMDVLCGEKMSHDQRLLLYSKVISFERIRKDF